MFAVGVWKHFNLQGNEKSGAVSPPPPHTPLVSATAHHITYHTILHLTLPYHTVSNSAACYIIPHLIVHHYVKRLFKKHDHILVAFGDIFSLCWKNNNLHILNNKTEDCLSEMPAHWSKPKVGYRYIDCGGETAWLNDCSKELESGPIYFARDGKTIVIIQWSMDSKVVNGMNLHE